MRDNLLYYQVRLWILRGNDVGYNNIDKLYQPKETPMPHISRLIFNQSSGDFKQYESVRLWTTDITESMDIFLGDRTSKDISSIFAGMEWISSNTMAGCYHQSRIGRYDQDLPTMIGSRARWQGNNIIETHWNHIFNHLAIIRCVFWSWF